MFALIYLAVGALVGAVVRSPVNGTVLILFVWIPDVFFGPLFGGLDRAATRGLPTHFVTLWMVDLSSRHAGRPGDLGWAAAWTSGALALSWVVIAATSRVNRGATRRAPGRPRPAAHRPARRRSARAGPDPGSGGAARRRPGVHPRRGRRHPDADPTLRLTDETRLSR